MGNRKSQNDICLSNTSGLLNLDSFKIHDIPFNFSDHCPISLSCNLTSKEEALPRLVSEDLLSQSGMRAPKRPKQLRNGDVNWEAFKNSANINLRKIQSNMCNYNLQSQEGFNEVFDQIENAIYNTALQCRILIIYCKNNHIQLEISKCDFIVINGNDLDKADFVLLRGIIRNTEFITLLGSQISRTGKLKDDLNLHTKKRFHAINKFYNFLRDNKLAPISVKLKVLEACVFSDCCTIVKLSQIRFQMA